MMKNLSRLFYVCALGFCVLTACNQNPSMPAAIADAPQRTGGGGTPANNTPIDMKKAREHENFQKEWDNSSSFYLNLKFDGSYEGVLEVGVTSVGKWTLTDDEKTLTLIPEKSLEGKGGGDKKVVYSVVEIGNGKLTVQEAETGRTIEFKEKNS
jgi:hypothetical protein